MHAHSPNGLTFHVEAFWPDGQFYEFSAACAAADIAEAARLHMAQAFPGFRVTVREGMLHNIPSALNCLVECGYDRGEPDDVLAACSTIGIALAAWRRAVGTRPEFWITARQGARLVRDSRRDRVDGA